MQTIGKIVPFLVVITLGVIYSGYALSIMWGWFLVPALGAPAISVSYAIGITMVVRYLTSGTETEPDDGKSSMEKLIKHIVIAVLKPSFALAFGYIVTLFV
jgi:hypothetical protein